MYEERRDLLERLRSERAVAADHTITIDMTELTRDQRDLLTGFVDRGVIISLSEGYYLDEEALARENRPGRQIAVVGVIVLFGLIGGMMWLQSH